MVEPMNVPQTQAQRPKPEGPSPKDPRPKDPSPKTQDPPYERRSRSALKIAALSSRLSVSARAVAFTLASASARFNSAPSYFAFKLFQSVLRFCPNDNRRKPMKSFPALPTPALSIDRSIVARRMHFRWRRKCSRRKREEFFHSPIKLRRGREQSVFASTRLRRHAVGYLALHHDTSVSKYAVDFKQPQQNIRSEKIRKFPTTRTGSGV